jgi:hypothetical protein
MDGCVKKVPLNGANLGAIGEGKPRASCLLLLLPIRWPRGEKKADGQTKGLGEAGLGSSELLMADAFRRLAADD